MSALAPVDAIPEDIKRAARKAIWGTGRGMIGRERNYLEYRVQRAILAERQRCIEAAKATGNFGDYQRDELTADYGQPRFDMMNEIVSAISNPHLPSGAAACSADTSVVTLLPATEDKSNHESDGPKSRPGDAAASLTQIEQQLATGKTSAQERSSDRSGGQFGDAPKPAQIQRADGGADITMTHTNIAGV